MISDRATTFTAFRALAGQGNLVPVWRELPADCLTPVMAWRAVAARSRRSFLLESVEGGERIARYSFVGADPHRVIAAFGDEVVVEERGRARRRRGDFLQVLREAMAGVHPVRVPGLPRFAGGAVGYIAWEAVRLFEPAVSAGRRGSPLRAKDPDAWFGLYDDVLAFDHLRQSLLLLTWVRTDGGPGPLRSRHREAVSRLERLARRLSRPPAAAWAGRDGGGRPGAAIRGPSDAARRRRFGALVRRAQESIRSGDVYQVVLSQRFHGRLAADPFSVYRSLRRINPSPYMYYLRDGEMALVGASPEMLVRVEGRNVEMHPIAGTRPRGSDAAGDAAMERELLADPKERAEHVMLVDLGRNDLGRVCAAGSVAVPEFMTVQRFSHVIHLVSRVTGRLAPGQDAFDALRAVFPAGTVSGAPKVRAMQIIEELEGQPRGPYAGAVCYVDHSGNLDSCIVIRTMVARGREAWVQAGAGIVADSDPAREHAESVSKARAVLSAMEGARWLR